MQELTPIYYLGLMEICGVRLRMVSELQSRTNLMLGHIVVLVLGQKVKYVVLH